MAKQNKNQLNSPSADFLDFLHIVQRVQMVFFFLFFSSFHRRNVILPEMKIWLASFLELLNPHFVFKIICWEVQKNFFGSLIDHYSKTQCPRTIMLHRHSICKVLHCWELVIQTCCCWFVQSSFFRIVCFITSNPFFFHCVRRNYKHLGLLVAWFSKMKDEIFVNYFRLRQDNVLNWSSYCRVMSSSPVSVFNKNGKRIDHERAVGNLN